MKTTQRLLCLLMTATLSALLTSGTAAAPKKGIDERDWTYIVEMPVPPRRGKEQPPRPACLWLPKGVDKVRGLFYPGGVMIDKQLGTDRKVREALAKEKMGVLFFHLGSNFVQGGGKYLDDALARLAKVNGVVIDQRLFGLRLISRDISSGEPDVVPASPVHRDNAGNFARP